jgi:hypothetical protein
MTRTFFDSGVPIAAARSIGPDRERALQLLEDPNRSFLTGPFVQLEVRPKAIFYKKRLERLFYERYFGNAIWYRDVARIEAVAQAEGTKAGFGAMDSFHLAAAHLSRADELITTEKPLKAIHRSTIVKVVGVEACGRRIWTRVR